MQKITNMKVLSIVKTFPSLEYDSSPRITESFIINSGYLRFAIDSTYPDKESASVLIKVGSESNFDDNSGYLITRENEAIIKIQSPKKFIGTKIYPNFSTTLIDFGNNGVNVDHPFKVGEFVTITNAVDDTYNQSIIGVPVVERFYNSIAIGIDLGAFTELNSSFTVNLATRVSYMSPRGSGLLNIAEVRPVG